MAEIPPVIGGDTATAAWANLVSARTAQRYANVAARDASVPAPVAGMLAWLEDIDQLTMYHGAPTSGWRTVAAPGAVLESVSYQPGVIVQHAVVSGSGANNGTTLFAGALPNLAGVPDSLVTVTGTVTGTVSTTGSFGFDLTTNTPGAGATVGDPVGVTSGVYATAWATAQVPLGGTTLNILAVMNGVTSGFYRFAIETVMY